MQESRLFAKGKGAHFRAQDRGNGRIALQSLANSGFVTAKGMGGMGEIRIERQEQCDASLIQWQYMLQGDIMLMSLVTHKYLFVDPLAKSLGYADAPGARPDRKDRSCFVWKLAAMQ